MTRSSAVQIQEDLKGHRSKGPKVLLVDNEADGADSLKQSLQGKGYQVCTALDGMTALEEAKQERPDLILLDLVLPRLEWTSVLKLLKSDERCWKIPVLVMTARENIRELASTLEGAAVSCTVKPVKFETLLTLIQTLLGGSEQSVESM